MRISQNSLLYVGFTRTIDKNKAKNIGTLNNFDGRSISDVHANYYQNMFKTQLRLQNISFKHEIVDADKLGMLKNSLRKICQETINAYDTGDRRIEHNEFTRCFVHHCFGFNQDEGSDLEKFLKNPLGSHEWGYYQNFKMKQGGIHTIQSWTVSKMQSQTDSWINKFIKIIENEQENNKNNLLNELLNKADNLAEIKQRLGVIS